MANKQKIVLLLDGDAKGAIKATQLTGKGLDSVTQKGKRASSQFSDIAKKGAKWGAVAAGAAAAGAAVLIKQQLDLIDNTAKTSDKLGIATEKLTAMRVQAELTGVAQGTLDKGLQQMIKGVADAAEGTGLAADSLAKLNLNAEELKNLSPDQQFYAIADAMEDVKNNTDKVSIAYDLFGVKGTALINTLRGGSAAALEAQKFTDQWGLAINRVDSSKIEQANDAMTMLGQASQGFWRQLTVNVSPAITGMAKEMLGFGETFGTSEELADRAFKAMLTGAGFVADMGRGLQIIWKGATLVVAEWFTGVWEAIAGADKLLTGLLNKLPEAMGGGSFETSDFLQNVSGALRNTADDISSELSALVNGPLPSDLLKDKIKEWEETATAAGEKVAASAKVVAGDYEAAAGAAGILTAAEQKRRDEAEKLAATKAELLGDSEYQVGLLSRELTATYQGAEALAAFNREKVIEAALRTESAQNLLPDELAKYTAMIGAQYDLAEAINEKTEADKAAADAAKEAGGAMGDFLNGSFGDGLAEGFNQGSKALASFIDGFGELLAVQDQYNAAQLDATATDSEKAQAASKYQSAQIGLYGDMAAASKQFFEEGSKGYEALQAAEQTFRAVEIAMAGKALFAKLFATQTATAATLASVPVTVAAEGAKATAAGAAAAASSMVGSPFPLNLGALAATVAALAGIGVLLSGGSGGGGISTAQQAQQAQGVGTVLGDSTAKSESALNALELMEDHLSDGLQVSNGMLAELRTLNANIAGLGSLLGRQLDFAGGLVNAQTGSSIGSVGTATNDLVIGALDIATLGFGEDLDKLLGGLFSSAGGAISSKKSSKVDEGLQILGGSVADIIDGGMIDAFAYANIQTKKRKLGSGTKTSNSIITESLGDEIAGQFGQVIGSIYTSLYAAADTLGIGNTGSLGDFEGFQVSTFGLTAEDAQKEVESVLSALADELALTVIPSLVDFQNVGEGLFETLARVATQTAIFRDVSESLGISIANLKASQLITVADDLAAAAGGIGQFASNVQGFTDFVLTDADKFAKTQGYVAAMFERLGLAIPQNIESLKEYITALDLSSAANQIAFTTITGASDLLDDYYSQLEDYTKSAYDFDTALGLNDGRKELREALAAVGHNLDVVETAAMGGVSALADLFSGLTDVQKAGLEPFTDALLDMVPALSGIVEELRAFGNAGIGTLYANQNLSSLQAEYASLVAAAKGGDLSRAGEITGVGQSVINAAANTATSEFEYRRIVAETSAAALQLADYISGDSPELSVAKQQLTVLEQINSELAGTDVVAVPMSAPSPMVYVPQSKGNDSTLVAQFKKLEEKMTQLITETRAGHGAIANNTGKTAKLLDRWDDGDAMATREVSA
jgi:hypothetical protein